MLKVRMSCRSITLCIPDLEVGWRHNGRRQCRTGAHAVPPPHAPIIVINGCSPAAVMHYFYTKARIAEEAGACAVMALERVPADIRATGGVARMASARLAHRSRWC